MSSWQIVAHECEVANPGEYVLLPGVLGRNIVVSNFSGLIKAWDNICPHRGARMLDGPCGKHGARVECPYHGRKIGKTSVRDYPTAVCSGWVWADLGASGQVPEGWPFPPLRPPSGTKLFRRLDIVIDCDWRVAVENALEFEHVRHVHPNTFHALGPYDEKVATDDKSGWSRSTVRLENDVGLDRGQKFFPHCALAPLADYTHQHLAPYTCLSSVRGFTYSLQHYFPRADGKTDFVHRIYAPPTTRDLGFFFEKAAQLNEAVFREDAEICARVPGYIQSETGPGEARIAHFRKWLCRETD